MKKLMIAAAIVCAAAMSQAAAITWTSDAMVDHTGTAIAKNSTAYTATISFFADALGKTDISSQFAGTLEVSTAAKGGVYSADTKDGMATGTYYAQLVIQNADWKIESSIAEFAYDSQAYSGLTLNFQTGSGFTEVTAKMDNTSSSPNYGWQSVPEPTSGLLLLLGVAGLALRRRRA